jgi:hypothetical protein
VARHFYIDGYNVIHHCPRLQQMARTDFEGSREALVDLVARFCAYEGVVATVVFDGRGARTEAAPPIPHAPGLEVFFSASHLSADSVIERKVYQADARRQEVVVVSGDLGIRELCRAMGSLVMSAANFLDTAEGRIGRGRAEIGRTTAKRGQASVEERLDGDSAARLLELRQRLQTLEDTERKNKNH